MIVDPDAPRGDVLWEPDGARKGESNVASYTEFLRGHGIEPGQDYASLWQWSVAHPETFWSTWAEFSGVRMGGQDAAVRSSEPMPHTTWFPGRTVNFARHLLEGREGTAFITLSEAGDRAEISFSELRRRVAALAEHLASLGVGHGDVVAAILPNVVEAAIGLFATASLGAIWSICAPEFGSGAIISRFTQLKPKALIAAPGYRLSGKERPRTTELAEVFAALPTVRGIVWVTAHTETDPIETRTPAVFWENAMSNQTELTFAEVAFTHPLWVLFSSGTTGVPKGIVHGHGGALLEQLKLASIHDDIRSGDRALTLASTSWVVWNGLVSTIGVGATAILLDGNPTYPDLDRVWQIVEDESVAFLGLGAGFIHASLKAGARPNAEHDLSSLRTVAVTGSPLSDDGFRWVYQGIGDVWLTSQSGGTDIASIFVGGVPTLPVRTGYIQAPALGVRVESWDDRGNPADGKGELVVTDSIPSMPLHFVGDIDGERYRASYFDTYPGVWRHGDFIEFHEHGILIHGRSDSTLNRNGIRFGPADMYAVVEALPEVTESIVIGVEEGDDGYYMPLFLHIESGYTEDEAFQAVESAIRTNLSARYLPDEFIAVSGIPHTKTGKKLEVPVKRLLMGVPLDEVADLGAIDSPEVMREFAVFASTHLSKEAAHGTAQ